MLGDNIIWSMFFSGIVSFQYHPANQCVHRMPLEQCADIADAMMVEYEKRFLEELEVL